MPTLSEAADNLQTSGYPECARLVRKAEAVLKGYEQWEKCVLKEQDDDCWTDCELTLRGTQIDRLIELQQLRNAALTQ